MKKNNQQAAAEPLYQVSNEYIPCTPPYKVIIHGTKMGVQIARQGNRPVVAGEGRPNALEDKTVAIDNSYAETWDVDASKVSELCTYEAELKWGDFIKILWYDHDRLSDPCARIRKDFIHMRLRNYIRSLELPVPGLHTVHLRLNGEAVCSARDDAFALCVGWNEDPAALAAALEEDVTGYLIIISPGREARFWTLIYETTDERLRPVVELLNANPKATRFRRTLMGGITVKALYCYDEDAPAAAPTAAQPAKVLDDRLNGQRVADALRSADRLGLGEKQFAWAVRDFLRSISWLTTTTGTEFVAWMKANGIIDIEGRDLRNVKRNDKMDRLQERLRQIFQECNQNTKEWEDKRDYYNRTDGRRINDGHRRQ